MTISKFHTRFLPFPGLRLLAMLFMFVIFFLIRTQTFSQERHVIRGIIYEMETEMPLAGAHILIHETSFGTISGPDGSFRLSVSDFPLSIKVTHIGFEDRYFKITEDFKDETLMLGMNFSTEMLEGVTITDQKAELIFRDNTYAVFDFEFHENGLMLLIYRNRLQRAELVLLSFMNDTLALLKTLPGKAESLHRDCLGFIHYLSDDTAYQIQYTGAGLQLIYPMAIKFFKPVADAFVAFHDRYYYFGVKKMNKLMIEYLRYDTLAETYSIFKQIYDRKKLQILKDNPWHHMLLANPVSNEREFALLLMGASESIDQQIEALKVSRDASIEGHYLRSMVYTPVYAPLFKSGDHILIFNHPESQIEFFSPSGESIKSTPISYHEQKNWEELILKDEIRDEYFIVFINSNKVSLHSVDIHSGTTGPQNILYYPFVKKILIRNAYVYFTYRQPGSIERTMLFRQKLKKSEIRYQKSEIGN